MACVEAAIPIPNPRKKTDELFLSWLSEPSTQKLLRKEILKMSGVPFNDLEDNNVISKDEQNSTQNVLTPSLVTNVLRPASPMRTPSPPHSHLSSSRSPKSSRSAGVVGRSSRSPKKSVCKNTSGVAGGKVKSPSHFGLEEVDGEINGVHFSLPGLNGESLLDIYGHRQEQEQRVHTHSPKPDSCPKVTTANHIPKLGATIPRFYFPNGKPQPGEDLHERFSELTKLFETFEGEVGLKQFGEITKVSFHQDCSVWNVILLLV